MSKKVGVFLCTCDGEIENIDFKYLKRSAKRNKDVKFVEIVGSLCKREGLPYLVQYIRWQDERKLKKIVITCHAKTKNIFLDVLDAYGLSGDSLEIINIRNMGVATEKVAELIDGGIKKVRAKRPLSRAEKINFNLDLCVNKTIVGKKVDIRGCVHCIEACPYGALSFERDMYFAEELCQECGICAAACPQGAIQLPQYNIEERLDTLTGSSISFSCAKSLSDAEALIVPCLGILDELTLLRAITVAGTVLLSGCRNECAFKTGFEEASRRVNLVKRILAAFDIEGDRIQIDSSIKSFPLLEFKSRTWGISENKRESLITLLQEYSRISSRFHELTVKDRRLPFGIIKINDNCTSCGACAIHCGTNALEKEGENISFTHALCVACEICRDICPEKAIEIEKRLDLERFIKISKEVFKPELARCANCGKPFISKRALERIAEMLREKIKDQATLEDRLRSLKLCPDCKMGV
jgi:ferredoxin